MRVASIDIGTNSTRLLVLNQKEETRYDFYAYQDRITKLGAGLSAKKILSDVAMQRVLDALLEFQPILKKAQVEQVQTFATSATRDAVNRQDFITKIFEQTQLECRVLSGMQEAKYSFLGAISDMQPQGNYLVCDIGGGSTEFIFATGKNIEKITSLNIGSGRLTRAFFTDDSPQQTELETARKYILEHLGNSFAKAKIKQIICTGGTAATLALMDLHAPVSNPFSAHHHIMHSNTIAKQIEILREKTDNERQSIMGLAPERSSLIIGGALVMLTILDFFQKEATISLRDLMYGVWHKGEP